MIKQYYYRMVNFILIFIITGKVQSQVIEAGGDLGIRVVKPKQEEYKLEPQKNVIVEAKTKGTSIVILGEEGEEGEEEGETYVTELPESYVVKEGDTLWSISQKFFGDPYQWPKLWSLNPEITNPHWIYPGQIIRLSIPQKWEEEVLFPPPLTEKREIEGKVPKISYERLPAGTIFLRNYGFIDKEVLDQTGLLVGSSKETEYLTAYDEAYVEFGEKFTPRPGDIYTIYTDIREVYDPEDEDELIGYMVEFLGLARILSFNPQTRIAKVLIIESIKPLERGYKLASIQRSYSFVPPVRNEVNLKGKIIAFLEPVNIAGDQMVAFVNKGYDDGVKIGNRFFVVRKRDMWRESRGEPDDRPNYPYEVIGELRVVETRAHTSTCWVTFSRFDLHVGEEVEMIRGY